MSTWPGIDEFRRILAEYGHPEDRIEWLAGLVSTPGLGEPTGHSTGAALVYWQFTDGRQVRICCGITLELRALLPPITLFDVTLPWSGDYQRIGTLVWQDTLKTLGIAAEVTA